MRVSILIKSGPARGRRMMLRAGQIAKFGRSDWADFPISDDDQLEDLHFEVDCRSNFVRLAASSATSKIFVGQKEVTEAELHHRDVVRAGNSEFEFDISAMQEFRATDSVDAAEPQGRALVVEDVVGRAEYLELSEDAVDRAAAFDSFQKFGEELRSSEMWSEAILWQAFHSTKQDSIAWACKSIQRYMPELNLNSKQTAAYELAARWVEQPSEELRLQALLAAEKLKFCGIGASVAIAVGWSSGSLTPNGFEPVAPDPRSTARWVHAGLLGVVAAPRAGDSTRSFKAILDDAPTFFNPLTQLEA